MSGRAPFGCFIGKISSSPPIKPVSSATGFGRRKKLAPLFTDFQATGPPGDAENRQLCESTFMFGSAWPFELGMTKFAAKVAGAGAAGGLKALLASVCLAYQVLVRQMFGSQLWTLSAKTMLALPSLSKAIRKYSNRSRLPGSPCGVFAAERPRPLRQIE